MDSDLYSAAISGDINFLRHNEARVGDQVAKNEDSVLHLASLSGQTECVQEILKMHPSLLCKVNSAGETALHLAAKCGCYYVVRELINESKKSHFPPLPPPPYYQSQDLEHGAGFGLSLKEMMLRVPNVEKDTALHEASRYNRFDVVKLLVEEDPHDSHTPNKADESPLYLAAYRGFDSIVEVICETCTSPAYCGSDGRTVLHASVKSCHRNSGLITYLLGRNQVLIKKVDKHGWTALHYAAFLGYKIKAMSLLHEDKSIAYLPDYIKKRTALHIAASECKIETMKAIIQFCPDCCTMVNQRAQNILHIAIERGDKKTIGYFSPLDTIYCVDKVVANQARVGLELLNGGANRTRNLWRVIRGEENFSLNVKDETQMIVQPENKRLLSLKKMDETHMIVQPENKRLASWKKVGETHMVVAALIATITFTAGFTLPGGFDGNPGANQGMTILSSKAAFQVFIIADLIALLFSTTSLLMYFVAAMLNS